MTVFGIWIFFMIFFLRSFSCDKEEIYETLHSRVFDHISKHLKASHKYSAARRIVNSLLDV